MTASHCRFGPTGPKFGKVDGIMPDTQHRLAILSICGQHLAACDKYACAGKVHCNMRSQADAGPADTSLCWLQVTAVPASRQGSGVSMHELRLPSSSSVTAHRSDHAPSLSLMDPSGHAYCKAHLLLRGVPTVAFGFDGGLHHLKHSSLSTPAYGSLTEQSAFCVNWQPCAEYHQGDRHRRGRTLTGKRPADSHLPHPCEILWRDSPAGS